MLVGFGRDPLELIALDRKRHGEVTVASSARRWQLK
jgi:hypothetical protein